MHLQCIGLVEVLFFSFQLVRLLFNLERVGLTHHIKYVIWKVR